MSAFHNPKAEPFEVTLVLNEDDIDKLKAAIVAYASSNDVTIHNVQNVRELYLKLAPAWNNRQPIKSL